MILKSADDKSSAVAQLEFLLKSGRVPPDKTRFVEQELRAMKAGIRGEEESAYQIDFHLRDSRNTVVLHDLRFELPDGRVAQIDHLLLHRSYRFYVLETKNFSHGVKITDEGEFLRWNDWKKTYEGIPSPIEQNARHVLVLQKLIERLGLPAPTIKALVLVAPTARIDRSKTFDSSMVVKADQFLAAVEKDLADRGFLSALGGLAKASLNGSHEEVAKKLLAHHKPIAINYVAKFGLTRQPSADAPPAPAETPSAAPVASPPAAQPADDSSPVPRCRACGSAQLGIEYGRYGYYFKCRDCEGNTPIRLDCGKAGHKERLRKDGKTFFRECAACGTSEVYFRNP